MLLQAFVIIMFVGIASTILLLPPNRVIRADGTLVKLEVASSPKQELRNFGLVLKDKRIIALIPMFFASNYFYAYQGAVNAFHFDAPTRAVNGALEGSGAILGALIIGFFVLDGTRFKRRTRGYMGLAFVFVVTTVVWAAGLSWQVSFTRESTVTKIHYKDANYHAKGALYFFCELRLLYFIGLY